MGLKGVTDISRKPMASSRFRSGAFFPLGYYNLMYQAKQNFHGKCLHRSLNDRNPMAWYLTAYLGFPDCPPQLPLRSGTFFLWRAIIRCIRRSRTAMRNAYTDRKCPQPNGMEPNDIADISRQSSSSFCFRSGPFIHWIRLIRCI